MERTKALWIKMTSTHNWGSCNSDLQVLLLHWPGHRAELLLLTKCDGLQELHLEIDVMQGEENSPFLLLLMGNSFTIEHPNTQWQFPKMQTDHLPMISISVTIQSPTHRKLSFLFFIKGTTTTDNPWNFNLNNYVAFLLTFYLILPAPAAEVLSALPQESASTLDITWAFCSPSSVQKV